MFQVPFSKTTGLVVHQCYFTTDLDIISINHHILYFLIKYFPFSTLELFYIFHLNYSILMWQCLMLALKVLSHLNYKVIHTQILPVLASKHFKKKRIKHLCSSCYIITSYIYITVLLFRHQNPLV